jgi:hypothetical protein
LVALALLAGACASSPAPRGFRTGPDIARSDDAAVFTVDCTFSHRRRDDPIVHPHQPGLSHPHDFFGNVTTDADSTVHSLAGKDTSCVDPTDTAAYWAPTLYRGATAIRPRLLRAYYRAAVGADVTQVRLLPAGLQLLAGNALAAPGQWSPTSQAGWGCGLRPRRWRHVPPSDCVGAAPLTLRLVFPDCWDGHHVVSADHRSHVAYSVDGRCPSSHPMPILQVQMSISYPVVGSTSRLTLASGGWQTTHGDFLNAWNQSRLRHHTDLCIRAMANCTIA